MASLRFFQFTRRPRRGSATLWLVMWMPCLMALFCVLVGVANLWLARIELENAMEAAALAAVKAWGDGGGGPTLAARQTGVDYAEANAVRRDPVIINTNYNPGGGPNENDQCDPGMSPPSGNLVFGAIDHTSPNNVVFDADGQPNCQGPDRFGVRAQAIVPVQPLGFQSFLGNLTQYCIQAKATAEYDCASGRARLVRVDSFICP